MVLSASHNYKRVKVSDVLGMSIGHRHKHVIATFCLLHNH
jgi:hypothetical protein